MGRKTALLANSKNHSGGAALPCHLLAVTQPSCHSNDYGSKSGEA
jgi:hypothetical protein